VLLDEVRTFALTVKNNFMKININPDWKEILQPEFNKPYFNDLLQSITLAYKTTTVYPESDKIFNALNLCPFSKIKVVIIGQDPYHGEKQAHGLCFSVQDDIKIPPSLKNIYKEIKNDIGKDIPSSGNLEYWAKQGVLLLNATLTVRAGEAGSHHNLGWEIFTDTIIKTISDQKENVVFLLWGKFAESKKSFIDNNKHLILTAPHPSPLSAHKGWFGSGHFSQTNKYLKETGQSEIVW